jgi:polyhydroxyalkanoate synthesis repressor PhaR
MTMSETSDSERLIKKYPNRRLYDTTDSRYITLDDAKQMVIDGVPFKVVDQKTGEDLTRSILLQIIMEQEGQGETLFTNDVLSEFIRNYGANSRENFSSFLQASMRMFNEQQAQLVQHMDRALEGTPMDFWMKMTQQNLENFQKLQTQIFTPAEKDDSKSE